MPSLKGTEVSLSYVQCFLYLVSSFINVSIFHSVRLGTFWTDLVHIHTCVSPWSILREPDFICAAQTLVFSGTSMLGAKSQNS